MQALKVEAGVKGAWVGIGVLAAGLLWSGAELQSPASLALAE